MGRMLLTISDETSVKKLVAPRYHTIGLTRDRTATSGLNESGVAALPCPGFAEPGESSEPNQWSTCAKDLELGGGWPASPGPSSPW